MSVSGKGAEPTWVVRFVVVQSERRVIRYVLSLDAELPPMLDKAEFPTEEDMVFIASCSTMGTSGDEPQSVHLDPWVRASSLGHNLERYMEERRSVLDWETLFRGLNSLDEGSTTRSQLEEDLDRLSRKLDVELAEQSKTPFKKRTKLEVVSPPEEFASVAEFAWRLLKNWVKTLLMMVRYA